MRLFQVKKAIRICPRLGAPGHTGLTIFRHRIRSSSMSTKPLVPEGTRQFSRFRLLTEMDKHEVGDVGGVGGYK